MTAATSTAPGVTQGRVIVSEWIKFRSVRSSGWTLATGVVLLVGLGVLIAAATVSQWDRMDPSSRALVDPINTATSGSTFAQLALGVLAVLTVTGEYGTGMIRASLTVVPKRLPVFWAKLAVVSGVTFVVGLAASLLAFFAAQSILAGKDLGASITDEGALRAIFGLALYLSIGGVIAMALGVLLRTTAAAITTLVAVFLVLPPLVSLLPASVSDDVLKYLPTPAGQAMYIMNDPGSLSASGGLIVFGAYAVILVAAAAWRLQRTDV